MSTAAQGQPLVTQPREAESNSSKVIPMLSANFATEFKRLSRDTARRARFRSGLTLVEMMVSLALTLMVVFALVRVFELLGNNVTDGRSTIEMSGNLRTASDLLRQDLAGMTTTTLPPRSPSQDGGYFEMMDPIGTDMQHIAMDVNGNPQPVNLANQQLDDDGFLLASVSADGSTPIDTSVGDVDDILAFTSRRANQPFTGLISDPRILSRGVAMISAPGAAPTQLIEAQEAEIIWWLQPTNNTEFVPSADITAQIANGIGGLPQLYPNGTRVRSLHRRVLLIRPDLDLSQIEFANLNQISAFLNTNDISVRVMRVQGGSYRLVANSLGDLTARENRAYRFPMTADATGRPSSDPLFRSSEMRTDLLQQNGTMKDLAVNNGSMQFMMIRKGKDVVLSDVVGFDLQVWDPEAVVRVTDDGTAVTPSDPGYVSTTATNATLGAYVDLGFAAKLGLTDSPGQFAYIGNPVTQRPIYPDRATYCTWSSRYEYDGFDQDGDGIADESTNNLDDNNVGGADDPSELETLPPYPHHLRGIKVSMRIMDSGTRQVRQSDVIHDFIAE